MKIFILLLLHLGCTTAVLAIDQEGYILNNSGDTVKGFIDIEFGRVGFAKKELDLGKMEMVVDFKEAGGKYKRYKAGDISGYGFNYDDGWRHFVVLDWPKNSWKKSRGAFERRVDNLRLFIQRYMEGAVIVYKDYYHVGTNMMGQPTSSGPMVTDLYIHTNDMGYVEIAPINKGDGKKLKEFLMKYLSMEEDFLKNVDDKAKFSEAEEILKRYNDWVKNGRRG